MKCRAVRAWMLTDETPQRAPSPVRRHLQRCSRCRKRYGRLVRLIHEVRELPLPSGDCPARTELLQRLAALPAPAPSVEASPPVLRPTRGAGGRARWAVAAAVLLLAFGTGLILFTRKGGNPQQPSPPDSPSTATVPAERPLEDRLLEQHLRLAEAEGPAEQIDAHTHMSTDLHTESLRAARRGAEKDVAYLAWLHGRVVDEGIVRCAAELPGGGKASLSPVLAQLRRTADEAREARRESPKVAASMAVVEATAREAIRALEGEPAVRPLRPQPQPPVELAASNLLRVLVAESLLVVGEDDPVRRAGHSSRVADSLAKTIVEKGDTTDPQEAARLGEKLGAVVNRGVMSNLDQADPEDLDEEQKKEAEQVRKRAGDAVDAIKQNRPRVPEEARQGLERALEGKRPEKPHGHGKGKGSKKEKPKKPSGRPRGR